MTVKFQRICNAVAVFLAGLCVVLAPSYATAKDERLSVMVGGEANLDACGGIGVLTLRRVPGNTLKVRAGPGTNRPVIGVLTPDARVWVCDGRDGWLGVVVYSPAGDDCGVATRRCQSNLA